MISTHFKNIRQIGSFFQVGVIMKNIWNYHPVVSQKEKNHLQLSVGQPSPSPPLPRCVFLMSGIFFKTPRVFTAPGCQESPGHPKESLHASAQMRGGFHSWPYWGNQWWTPSWNWQRVSLSPEKWWKMKMKLEDFLVRSIFRCYVKSWGMVISA